MAVKLEGMTLEEMISSLPLPELVAKEAQKHGINRSTTKPLSFNDISNKIGDEPALLMLSMLEADSKCSKVGIETAIEVMQGIAGGERISVSGLDYKPPFLRPLNFTLDTAGFLKEDLDNYKYMFCTFRFTPESKYNKHALRDGEKGALSLDLEIEMFITASIQSSDSTPGVFLSEILGNVVVEFDGPIHLQDEKVRSDKERDSMVQALGKTVFRIQTPYKVKGVGSTKANNAELNALVKRQIDDIKEHFRNCMYENFKVSSLINAAIQADKAVKSVTSK